MNLAHLARPELAARCPVHITQRMRPGVAICGRNPG
jgi:hypothetical protein